MDAGLKDEEFQRLLDIGRKSKRAVMIVTIYKHPEDFPKNYVARVHILAYGGKSAYASPVIYIARETLDAVRSAIPEDMVKMCRNLNDDPVIVESYM